MGNWGRVVGAWPGRVLGLCVMVVLAATAYGIGVFGILDNGGFDDPGSESYAAAEISRERFGDRSADVVAIYSSDTLRADEPAFRGTVEEVLAGLPDDAVASVTPYFADPTGSMIGKDGYAGLVVITLDGDTQDEKTDAFDRVKDHLTAEGVDTHVAGESAVFDDVNVIAGQSIARAEMIALPVVFVLSLFIFGGLVAALMPTLVGAIAVVGSLAVLRLLGQVTDVSVFALNVVTLLGMGLAIDYALFVVSRFREELAAQPDTSRASSVRAMAATMATAGRTVLFSGLIVAASLSSLLIFPQGFLRSMGMGGVAAAVVAMLAALTVLPALLVLLGRRIDLGRLPVRRRGAHAAAGGAWTRIAHVVMGRPVVVLAVIVAGLVALGTPFYGVRWGGVDSHMLPPDAPAAQAISLQQDWFGGERSGAPIVLAGSGAADTASLTAYTEELQAVSGAETVRIVDRTGSGMDAAALVEVQWPGNGQSEPAQALVESLRAVELPGATAHVGGATASTVDLLDSIGERLPVMALVVVTVMLVLLFLAFGSVVLPVKAVVMNALSLLASFGVVTWIFADGHLEDLLGFTSPGYLDATQPILMLGILFGLSMDYEVFLLSRIKEEWDRTGDTTSAVATGLERSGRLITSAALLLCVVIGGFAASGLVFIKMIGIGMLVAIVVDATVVRALLVPATMRLLGRANWWAPAPLRRVARRFALAH